METRDLTSFIQSIEAEVAGLMEPEERAGLLREAGDLVLEIKSLNGYLILLESEGFRGWQDALKARCERELGKIVAAKTLDPYQAGRSFGKMALIAEQSADASKVQIRIERAREELSKIEQTINPPEKT